MTGGWVLRKVVKKNFFVFFMIFLKTQTLKIRNCVHFESNHQNFMSME